MKKRLLAGAALLFMFGTVDAKAEDLYKTFKDDLNKKTGLTYDGAVTALAQRGAPSGQITPIQMQYYGEANWDMFQSDWGNGSMQVAYTKVRYSGRTADELDQKLGVASDINDYSANANYLDQFSYTHQFVGSMKWLSLTFGQFPIYLFDSNPYLSNQQTDFNNLALAQNGTYSYPSASMGGFATITPTDDLRFAAGFQDANNTSGEKMEFSTFNDGDYTTFVYAEHTPTINGLGKGKYSLTLYNQPRTDGQQENTNGWSLNLSQDIGEKWAVFSRINGSTGSALLEQSYALGAAYKDPLERGNSLDRIGAAVAVNKLNKDEWEDGARDMETVFETYWNFGVGDYLVITPDFQYYVKPALNRDVDNATVYSIRATVLF